MGSASERIGVVGLGYVGLPVALAFAKHFPGTVGFDRDRAKVDRLRAGVDHTGEVTQAELADSTLCFTAEPSQLAGCTFFVVAVPTPVDADNRPDLRPLLSATETVGQFLKPGAIVVYESTVYPGVTEELCGPILARASGLTSGRDFKLGYSPERINPGDVEHTLERIVKVVSGEDAQALERIAAAYGRIVSAGVHRSPSIKVAEAAKVIENTQRDLNIALMNELSLIFDRMHIRTSDVLAAAKTKWNFLPFTPGLVGGHCIGVDPYYLTTKAAQLGYEPQVILAGRKINNSMAAHVAQRTVKLLVNANLAARGARVGVLGLTFKEDVSDIRNSKVPDIVRELKEFGVEVLVADPNADAAEVKAEYGLSLSPLGHLNELDALIVAVPHRQFRKEPPGFFLDRLKVGGVLVDLKHLIPPAAVPAERAHYWSL